MFKSVPSTVIAIAVLLLLWMPSPGFAGVIQSNGFVGYYSLTPKDGNLYGNWTLEGEGDYGVEVIDGGSKLRLSVGPKPFSELAFGIQIPADGFLAFSWSVENFGDGGFVYQLDNGQRLRPPPPGGEISVQANQTFTLVVDNSWLFPEEGVVAVALNNFSGPYVIPEPSTFGLMALAFAGFGLQYLWRRQKNMEARHRRRAAKLQSGVR